MNLVIHDLRTPAESIQEGLKKAQDLYSKDQNKIIQEVENVLKKNILCKTKYLKVEKQESSETQNSNFDNIQVRPRAKSDNTFTDKT